MYALYILFLHLHFKKQSFATMDAWEAPHGSWSCGSGPGVLIKNRYVRFRPASTRQEFLTGWEFDSAWKLLSFLFGHGMAVFAGWQEVGDGVVAWAGKQTHTADGRCTGSGQTMPSVRTVSGQLSLLLADPSKATQHAVPTICDRTPPCHDPSVYISTSSHRASLRAIDIPFRASSPSSSLTGPSKLILFKPAA